MVSDVEAVLERFRKGFDGAGPVNVTDIVSAYHSAISIRAGIQAGQTPGNTVLDEFDSMVHPMVLLHLDETVKHMTAKLQGGGDTAEFELLRQVMSTREFVSQYK